MIVMAEIPRATLTRQKRVLSLKALTASKDWMSSRKKRSIENPGPGRRAKG